METCCWLPQAAVGAVFTGYQPLPLTTPRLTSRPGQFSLGPPPRLGLGAAPLNANTNNMLNMGISTYYLTLPRHLATFG